MTTLSIEKPQTDKWITLAIVVIGTFMAILDTSIVNIAIPKMMAVFNVGTDQVEWVLTAYMLTMAVVIPLTGVLGEKFGLKAMYIFSLIAFTIGSLLCGLSWSLSSMVVARIIQAIGGGMIMPISMTIIYRIIPREKIGLAMGFWGIAVMAAPAIGPTLGGYLIEYVSWQFIFNVNIPIGIIAVAASVILLDNFERKEHVKIDYLGAVSIGISLITLLLALNNGNTDGWTSAYILSLFFVSIISFLFFVMVELSIEEPLLDLSMLRHFSFSLSLLINTVTTIALFGGIFLIPIYLQNLRGFSPLQAGLILLPSSLATAVMMPISGKLYDKYGAKYLVIFGMIMVAIISYQLCYLSLDYAVLTIVILISVRGMGMGLAMMPIQTYGMSDIPNHQIGKASALSGTCRQVSGSFGIALLSSVLVHQQALRLNRLSEAVNITAGNAMQLSGDITRQAMNIGVPFQSAKVVIYQVLYGFVGQQAAMLGIDDTFFVAALISVIGIFLAFFITHKHKHVDAIPELVLE